jgi:hypothetical protein
MRPHTATAAVASALRPVATSGYFQLLGIPTGKKRDPGHSRDTDHNANCLTRIPHNQPDPQTQQLP